MPLQRLPAPFLEKCRRAMAAEQAVSLAATNNWSHVDRQAVHEDWQKLYETLAPMVDGGQPDAPAVQALIAEHYAIASRFYVPSGNAYIGMALFYQENDAMRGFHNAFHPLMVEFLGDAVYVFSSISLNTGLEEN